MNEHYAFGVIGTVHSLLWHKTKDGVLYKQEFLSDVLRGQDGLCLHWRDGRLVIDTLTFGHWCDERLLAQRLGNIRSVVHVVENHGHVQSGLVRRAVERLDAMWWNMVHRIPGHLSPRARKRWPELRNADMLGCGCPPSHHGVKISRTSAIVDRRIAPLVEHLHNRHVNDAYMLLSSCQGGTADHEVSMTYRTDGYLTMELNPQVLMATVNRLFDVAQDADDFDVEWAGTDDIVRERRTGSVIAVAIEADRAEDYQASWSITWTEDRLADVVFDAVLHAVGCSHEDALAVVADSCDWCGESMASRRVHLNI